MTTKLLLALVLLFSVAVFAQEATHPVDDAKSDSKSAGDQSKSDTQKSDATKAGSPFGQRGAKGKRGPTEAPSGPAAMGIKAPDGFETKLFAEPPNVNYPTCLSATPDGVLFVGCDENGSLDAKADRGRIVRCVDNDGDGTADEFTVFAKIDSPRGIIVDGSAVYVLAPPKLTAHFDTNNDGVADREETLIDGIGRDLKFRGADHTTNGIRLAIDGYIYIACGDYGTTKATGKDGSSLELVGGGIVRVRTDGSGMEVISRGQRNIYDVAIDPYMNLFTRDNTNDGGGWDVRLSHVVTGGKYGYPTLFRNFNSEIVQPLADYGGGSPTGSLFVDEPTLPAPYNRALLTVEWGRNGIFRHPLTAKGATFTAGQEKFLDVPRPTDVEMDGVGRMYVSSWRGASYTYAGPNIGYVARVTPSNFKNTKAPEISKASDAELAKLIAGESAVLRLAAQRELLQRKEVSPAAIESLRQAVVRSGDLAPRVAAIYTVAQLPRAESEADLLAWAKNPELREFAIRALSERRGSVSSQAADAFVSFLSDADPRVRLQSLTALVRTKNNDAAAAMVPLTGDADPVIAHVARNGLASLEAATALLTGLDKNSPQITAGCLVALQQIHKPEVVDELISRVAKITDVPTKKLHLAAICRLGMREANWDGRWWGTRPDTTGPYFKPVEWEKSSQIQKLLSDVFARGEPELRSWILKEAQRNRMELPGATAEVLKLAQNDPAQRTEAALLLAALPTWNKDVAALIADVAKDGQQPLDTRRELIQQLIKRPDLAAARQGAFQALAVIGLTDTAKGLRQMRDDYLAVALRGNDWKTMIENMPNVSPAERELTYAALLKLTVRPRVAPEAKAAAAKAFEAAWQQPESTAELLNAIGATQAEQFATQVQTYRASTNPAIAKAAEFAATELRLDANAKDKITIDTLKYEDVVAQAEKITGDVELGSKLFLKQSCANCHTTTPGETPKGPFLGGISARYKRSELCESIIKPSEKIAQGFDTYGFLLEDGRVLDGFVVKDSGTEIEIRGTNGEPQIIKSSAIEQRNKRTISIMPNGLVDKLSPEELAAILAYLESLPAK